MDPRQPDFRRAETIMDERRQQLDMMWKDVAEAAKLSAQSLLDFRQGKTNPRQLTKRRIDAALGWEAGSLQAVLDGGDPTPLPEEQGTAEPAKPPPTRDDPRARIIAAALEGLTADEAEALLREVRQKHAHPPGDERQHRNIG